MIFYRIPAHAGQPIWLEATQSEARSACKARGLKPSEFEQIDIPTDKAGLMATLNRLYAAATASPAREEAAEPVEEPEARHMSQSDVDALFTAPVSAQRVTPRLFSAGADIDALEEAIMELEGHQLGNVAQTVCCRMKELAKPFLAAS
jgi:hypothetical protein